jgi:hypothetical protein
MIIVSEVQFPFQQLGKYLQARALRRLAGVSAFENRCPVSQRLAAVRV